MLSILVSSLIVPSAVSVRAIFENAKTPIETSVAAPVRTSNVAYPAGWNRSKAAPETIEVVGSTAAKKTSGRRATATAQLAGDISWAMLNGRGSLQQPKPIDTQILPFILRTMCEPRKAISHSQSWLEASCRHRWRYLLLGGHHAPMARCTKSYYLIPPRALPDCLKVSTDRWPRSARSCTHWV
jgi:hypothetical protein